MRPATIAFEVKLVFEDTRGREVLSRELSEAFLAAIQPALREFVTGAGVQLVRDVLKVRFGAAR